MDPFQSYKQVNNLIPSESFEHSKFRFDFEGNSKAIREAFESSQESKPYAVGGEAVAAERDNIFGSNSERLWLDFLLVRDRTKDDPKAKRRKTEDDETEPVPSLQSLALRAILREGKLPVDALLELAAPIGKEDCDAFEIQSDRIPHPLFMFKHFSVRHTIVDLMKWRKNSGFTITYPKMHIYGPGGFFRSQVEAPDAADHVGTIFVGLPTEHTGGNIVVTHQDSTSSFDLSNGSIQKQTYCAFRADCTYEVEEVTSGHCVFLQYNVGELSESNTDKESDEKSDEKSSDCIFKSDWIVERWSKNGTRRESSEKLCYRKNHSDGDGSPGATELAVLDYFNTLPNTHNVALLLKTHVLLYSNDPEAPGELLKGRKYIRKFHNGWQEGQMTYYACCLVLNPLRDGSS